jgi:uncharacterized membrane-anchored protein YhcB (DUF1043 family)
MKKTAKFFILFTFGVLLFFNTVALADNLEEMTDKFYDGLATVIEKNSDNPDMCIKEVNAYYEKNQKTVEAIRIETEKHMKKSAPMMQKMMEKYQNMSPEELEALQKQQTKQEMQQPPMSPGMQRYSSALSDFTMRYPHHGTQIAFKAMELAPKSMQHYQGYGSQSP